MHWNMGVGVGFLLLSFTLLSLCYSSEARNVKSLHSHFISPSGIGSVELKKEEAGKLRMKMSTRTRTAPESLFPPIIPPVLPSPPPTFGGVPLPPNPFQPPPLLPFPPSPTAPAFGLPPLIPGLIPSPPPPPPVLPVPLPPVIPSLPPLIPGVPPAN